jgi:hypothetical protein
MSCNTRPGPAAIIKYINNKTGYEVTSSDWHELTRRAERAGFEVSRTRVPIEDAEGSVNGLAESFGARREFDAVNGITAPQSSGAAEEDLINETLGEEGRLTQNHLAVLNYLTREEEGEDGEDRTPADKVAEIIAKRNIDKAAESDDYLLNIWAARSFPKNETVMDLDGPESAQEKLLNNEDARVRYNTAKNPNLNEGLIESLAESSDDVTGVLQGLVQNPKLREYGEYSGGPLSMMIANGHGTLAGGSKYLNSDLQQELAEEGDISALESLTRAIPDRQPARWLTRDEIIESGARDPWYEYNFMRLETERVILDRVYSEPHGEARHVAENLARYSPREETLAALAEPYGVEAEGVKSGTPIAEDYYRTVEYVVNNGFTSRETLEKIRDNTVWEYPSHIRERAREALETPDYKRVSNWEKDKRLA